MDKISILIAAKTDTQIYLIDRNNKCFLWLEKHLGEPSAVQSFIAVVWEVGNKQLTYNPRSFRLVARILVSKETFQYKTTGEINHPSEMQIISLATWLKQ